MLNSDLIVGCVCAVLTGLVYFLTRDLSRLGGVFVNYVLVALGFLSLLLLIKGLVRPERIKFFESAVERNNVLVGLIILALYLIVMPKAGFLPASYVFYGVFNLYLAEEKLKTRNILQSLGLSAVVVTVFYFIFHHLLEVPLPPGSWFES